MPSRSGRPPVPFHGTVARTLTMSCTRRPSWVVDPEIRGLLFVVMCVAGDVLEKQSECQRDCPRSDRGDFVATTAKGSRNPAVDGAGSLAPIGLSRCFRMRRLIELPATW